MRRLSPAFRRRSTSAPARTRAVRDCARRSSTGLCRRVAQAAGRCARCAEARRCRRRRVHGRSGAAVCSATRPSGGPRSRGPASPATPERIAVRSAGQRDSARASARLRGRARSVAGRGHCRSGCHVRSWRGAAASGGAWCASLKQHRPPRNNEEGRKPPGDKVNGLSLRQGSL